MIIFRQKEFGSKRVNVLESILNKIDTSISVELLKCIEFGDKDKDDLKHWINKIETNGFNEVSKDLSKEKIDLNSIVFFYGIHVNNKWLKDNINTKEFENKYERFIKPENYIRYLKEELIKQGKYSKWIGSNKKDLSKFKYSDKDLVKRFKEIEKFISKGNSLDDFFLHY